MAEQIPLPFAFNPELSFERFHPGGNGEVVRHLRDAAQGRGELLIFLWGENGTGKTHLLNACCRDASQAGRTISYLPLALMREFGPTVLDGLEHQELVCLDEIDAVAGEEAWEQGLFTLFNRLRESNHCLIAAAAIPPAELPVRLPDLKTRLGWGLTLRLQPLSDHDKLTVLSLHARSLGLDLPPKVGRFLLAHYRRDLPSLRRLLGELDHATLAAKRKLTIPFLKTYLEDQT
jgi:DnaA family protein